MTIISGTERRRRWSAEDREQILLAATAPGAIVAEVARQWDICTGLIYKWRSQARARNDAGGFAPLLIAETAVATPVSEPGPSIQIDIGGARVSIHAGAPASLVAATLKALRS